MGLITSCVYCGHPLETWVKTTRWLQSILAYFDVPEVFCSMRCHEAFKRFVRY